MGYNYYTKTYYSTPCHIFEFNPKEFRLDVSLGVRGKLETLSKINGEPKSNEKVIAKTNASFFAMNGKGGDTYSTLVDEGLYYHAAAEGYPTLVFWKDYKMEFEVKPNQSRLAYYQKNAFFAIGIGWTLVIDGKVNYTYDKQTLIKRFGHPFTKQPRTMIGQKANGNIVMVVTNGRVSGSAGLTSPEMADVMLKLGCKIAANMDGGGSSEMIINGKTVNRLQSNYHRPIGTAFLVYGPKSNNQIVIKAADVNYSPVKSGKVANASNVNVRTGPGTTYSALGTLTVDTKITVTGATSTQKWLRIKCDKYGECWISASYVAITTTKPTAPATNGTAKTTTANLNMRSGRGTNYPVLTTIPKDTKVTVSDLTSGWYKVTYNKKTGFCSAKYLK